MLNEIDPFKQMNKKDYKEKMKSLEKRLAALQQEIKEKDIPIIIAFEGFSASGKGTLIGRLVNSLDPRSFKVYTMNKVNEDAYMRPVLWSFWTKIPAKGQITIFDKSWHRAALPLGENKWKISNEARNGFFYDANAFEKQLTADGTIIIKIFLYINKSEQKLRFEELEKNPNTAWRVDEQDWEQNNEYVECLEAFEDMLEKTNNAFSPWHIVEAWDKRYATVKVSEILLESIEAQLKKRQISDNTLKDSPVTIGGASILSQADLTKDINGDEYKIKLRNLQEIISEQGYMLYTKRRSVIIVYEGWDAAGKGGNIKRLTEALDPRGYEVVAIGTPTKEDLAHNYLWRFWNKYPKDGHITIFDRSWYGRVMVERVEKFCTERAWQAAYKEINDTELHMYNHGSIIIKFWLHIDKNQQLARFKARQNNSLKQHKITDEDWRNREKWDLHEQAVNDMLLKTNTSYAPWHIIESNSKKYARIKTLEIVTDILAKANEA